MKRFKRIIPIVFVILIFFCSAGQVKAVDNVPVTGTLEHVLYEKNEESEGNDFITEAIKSIDENTAKQETDKNYIKNFYNSSQTVMTEGLNFLKPHTIVMTLINFLTMILEMIGIGISFIIMILYNFVSTSFMSTMVQGIFSTIDAVMFDWSNPNSWIIKVLVIMAVVSIGYHMIKSFTRLTNWKSIMQIVLSAFISVTFIIFIGQNGRRILGALEQSMQSMIVQTFVFDGQSGNTEISNKESIFDIMQLQPFMIRHYGTASYNQIAQSADQSVSQAKRRVQALLDNPTEDNADKEYDDYDNTNITHDVGSASMVLFLSVICLLHRVLIGVILLVFCMANGAVKLLKEILLSLSIYQLIWWLFRRDRKAREWFTARLMWSIAVIAVDILFSTVMYFILQVCAKISEISSLLMIGFDIILLFIVILLIKNISVIGSKLKDSGEFLMQAMLVGGTSPKEALENMRNNYLSSDTSGESSGSNSDTTTTDDNDDFYSDDLSDSNANEIDSSSENLQDVSDYEVDHDLYDNTSDEFSEKLDDKSENINTESDSELSYEKGDSSISNLSTNDAVENQSNPINQEDDQTEENITKQNTDNLDEGIDEASQKDLVEIHDSYDGEELIEENQNDLTNDQKTSDLADLVTEKVDDEVAEEYEKDFDDVEEVDDLTDYELSDSEDVFIEDPLDYETAEAESEISEVQHEDLVDIQSTGDTVVDPDLEESAEIQSEAQHEDLADLQSTENAEDPGLEEPTATHLNAEHKDFEDGQSIENPVDLELQELAEIQSEAQHEDLADLQSTEDAEDPGLEEPTTTQFEAVHKNLEDVESTGNLVDPESKEPAEMQSEAKQEGLADLQSPGDAEDPGLGESTDTHFAEHKNLDDVQSTKNTVDPESRKDDIKLVSDMEDIIDQEQVDIKEKRSDHIGDFTDQKSTDETEEIIFKENDIYTSSSMDILDIDQESYSLESMEDEDIT